MKFLNFIRKWLLDDVGWKLFSLLLAIVIWLIVHRIVLETSLPVPEGSGRTVNYGSLPVDLVSASADVREFRLLQNTVSVTVSGSEEAIGRLQANHIHAIVNLASTNASSTSRLPVEIFVPAGISVVSVSPENIGIIAPPPQ